VYLLTRAVPPFAITAGMFAVAAPRSAVAATAFVLSLPLAFLVSFAIRYLVALTAFWVTDARGVLAVSGVVAVFCSGAVLPLTIFPAGVGTVARLLPYAATVQVPCDLYLGRGSTLAALGFQAFWAVTLLAVAAGLTRRAVLRVVVQGG
jgi:viologen exporter family transport system permease protein